MGERTNGRQSLVVGFGARTPLGSWSLASTAAVRAGISMFAEHSYMIDKNGLPMVVARDPFLSAEDLGADRYVGLMASAAAEALSWLDRAAVGPVKVRSFLGLPPARPGLPARLADTLRDHLRPVLSARAASEGPQVVATGHSAGLMALQKACEQIDQGAADFCLVGGVDSYLEPETLEWIDASDRFHSECQSWGFIPGEAAGFVLIASPEAVARHSLPTFGSILAIATATERNLINSDDLCLGEGLSEAVFRVLDAFPSGEHKIHDMACDMNGEPYRADEFGYTVVRTSDRFVDASSFWTPADCWGDVGAASGPLFVILALAAELRGYAKGPHTLVWTSSDGGERSAAVVRTGKHGKG
jgi:3-oxoacyl-[acyl-carrier-protein] synthase-1